MPDQLLLGGTVVTPEGIQTTDLHITDGKIEAIGPQLSGAKSVIHARGLHVFPAVIDVHVHFNQPGSTAWEGAATGSRALAAGGGAVFFDMPLNSTPCTVDARAFRQKRAALAVASIADFALWGGLIPGSVPNMAEMAEAGAIGFKAFLCHSGLPEFPRADDETLHKGMREAARLRLPVAVHAENQEITAALARACLETGRTGIRDFLSSRPIEAELEAIERATRMAQETGVALHIVHISCGRGVVLAAEAKARGTDVSIETCPHYLSFTEEDVERLGAIAKCAPPLRSSEQQAALWAQVLNGTVEIVASDHSPALPKMKTGAFWSAWGGIAGVQSTLAVLLEQGHRRRGLPLERVASLVAAEPARRFRIAGKGRIEPGFDADLVLVDLAQSPKLERDDLLQRHRLSPYLGETFHGKIVRTVRRGETIFENGRIVAGSPGRFIRPECR